MSVVARAQTLRRCPDGHHWIDQGDGTVSPSWGLGGTSMPVDDPRLCPEPGPPLAGTGCWEHAMSLAADEAGAGAWGRTEDFWPPPACLKPGIWERRWEDRDKPWIGPHGTVLWLLWREDSITPRLIALQGSATRYWTPSGRCLDVLTGEQIEIDCQDLSWKARPATENEIPAWLVRGWPRWNGRLALAQPSERDELKGRPGPPAHAWIATRVREHAGAVAVGEQLSLLGAAA